MLNPEVVPEPVLTVCRALSYAGHEAVLVGGCVRDILLGKSPKDWDVATSAMPQQVMDLFDKTIPTGLQHGTVTVMMGGEPIEVTTYRSEGKYTDGRRPDEVRFGVTLKEDLSRRDFTVNAMAYDPIRDTLHDPFDGQEDIELTCIRAVGNPADRFAEDGLRMMRAIRFVSSLEFVLHKQTLDAICQQHRGIDVISSERVRDELMKTLAGGRAGWCLWLLKTSGIMSRIIPELDASYDHPQNSWHRWDVWKHTVETVKHTEGPVMRRMGALLHDVGKPATAEKAYEDGGYSFHAHDAVGAEMAQTIMERLKFSNEDKDRVVGMVRHHMFGYGPGTTKKAMRRFIKRVGFNLIPDLVALRYADIIGKGLGEDPEQKLPNIKERLWETMGEISTGKAAVSTKQLAITGHDVMQEMGIGPGREVGEILRSLLDRVVDDPDLNNKEALLSLLPKKDCCNEH